ncbi:hypothetical protein E7Z59_06960 [Robertkochia marina]|uniref:Uncharacterized protein n=1 Tax=Robertkochia marina TaxID=1227945 RepID=A0A4V3UY18_9FLAO|nr:hypothetical protein [Robertkochia marina]THD67396.1 hypothetical protein E7Z59_06960 [Robertkochia marina]TRZ43050.1 hypothetical protein D3A96_11265 [Robertkochia marina]
MPHILKNNTLEIHLDLPSENYRHARFDWTGKISTLRFHNTPLESFERADGQNAPHVGKGLYNEFGIDRALGFEETEMGGWFHKIGVGLLKKNNSEYRFDRDYEIDPADFAVNAEAHRVLISCRSKTVNGYSYLLNKSIELNDNSFTINYYLENTGKKDIITDEYTHNFIAIDQEPIGNKYILKFPFQIKPELFEETVNPEGKVTIGQNKISFNSTPKEPFFFSNLTGNELAKASWELVNLQSKIGISETGNFKTDKVNLWGWTHVISPELFIKIVLKPGKTTEWSRTYEFYTIH